VAGNETLHAELTAAVGRGIGRLAGYAG